MGDWIESFRGVVYPWHCDHLGHMNVKNYTGMFDQAAFHYQHALGFDFKDMADTGETTVDAQHTLRFVQEQLAGSLIVIEGALTRIGTKSITCSYRMRNVETGDLAATSDIVSVYFNLKTRSSMEIPAALRTRLQPFLVAVDDSA
jgi:acyl-CoA thioester hydrolase